MSNFPLSLPSMALFFQTFLQGWDAEIGKEGTIYSQGQGWFKGQRSEVETGMCIWDKCARRGAGRVCSHLERSNQNKKLKSRTSIDMGQPVIL